MDGLGRWDTLLLLAAVYVAVTSLVRLMTARRDALVADLQNQFEAQRGRRQKSSELDAEAP